jgi:hypothetical protein
MLSLTVVALLALAVVGPAARAAKKEKTVDKIWVHPEVDRFGVSRIALLPVVTYDNDFKTEGTVETAIGPALVRAGYRWVSATSVRGILREGDNDSVLKAVRVILQKDPRVDSLQAIGLCTRLHCDAILGVRVDQWEQQDIPYDQSGKPTTSIHLSAALVDSTGTLLWSALGAQTLEGPYHDANAGLIGAKASGLDLTPVTGQGGPPSFDEALSQLFKRWSTAFPAKRAAAAADSVPAPAH